MAKKIKISRKKLRQPDEFLTWTETAWEWAENHVWEVLGAGIAVVAVLLLAQGIGLWIKTRDQAPKSSMADALDIMRRPVESRTDDLFLTRNTFRSETEKYESMAAAFADITTMYPGTPEANLSMLYLAIAREELEKYELAIESYSNFLDSELGEADSEIKWTALMGLARCYYSTSKYEQALEKARQVIEAGSAFTPDALILTARIYEKTGEREKALQALEEVEKEYADTWIARSVNFLPDYWRKQEEEKELRLESIEFEEESMQESVSPGLTLE